MGTLSALPWAALALPAVGLAIWAALRLRFPMRGPETHGRSRWARARDLSPLLRGDGPALGRLGRQMLRLPSEDNLLVFGVQRSGKTSTLVVPAILDWAGALVATSTKDELVTLTGRRRRSAGPVYVFAPLDEDRAWIAKRGLDVVTWNPISEAGTAGRASELADLFTAEGKSSPSAHWYLSAANLLTALFIHQHRRGGDLGSVVELLNTTPISGYLGLGLEAGDPARQILRGFAATPEKEAAAVVSTARSSLALWIDERVAAATAAGDSGALEIETLLANSGTLYLVAPAEEAERCRPLFSALLAAILRRSTERARRLGGALTPRLLLALDEVANFARIPRLAGYVSTGPGQGIQSMLAFHDMAQLEATYGNEAARTIWNNCRCRLLLPGQGDLKTLEVFSSSIGYQTVVYGRDDQVRTSRPLMAVDDLARSSDPVLLYAGAPPARVRARRWDQVNEWRRMVAPSSSR